MKKVAVKVNKSKKPTVKVLTESKFWKQLALQQQVILHAKNNT